MQTLPSNSSFHFRESGANDASTFSSAALFLFFLSYISLATIVYGIAVPSGLFVRPSFSELPSALCGHLLHKLDHTSGTFADSGMHSWVLRVCWAVWHE